MNNFYIVINKIISFEKTKIKLPYKTINNNIFPDYQYMEDYIKNILNTIDTHYNNEEVNSLKKINFN